MARTAKGPRGAVVDPPEDLMDVFEQTAEDDAAEQKLSESAKAVKRAHLLSAEAQNRLKTCRLATSTTPAIRHDLQRVIEICEDLSQTASEALHALGR